MFFIWYKGDSDNRDHRSHAVLAQYCSAFRWREVGSDENEKSQQGGSSTAATPCPQNFVIFIFIPQGQEGPRFDSAKQKKARALECDVDALMDHSHTPVAMEWAVKPNSPIDEMFSLRKLNDIELAFKQQVDDAPADDNK